MFAYVWKHENISHLNRNCFDQNIRATSEQFLYIIGGRKAIWTSEWKKIIANKRSEGVHAKYMQLLG